MVYRGVVYCSDSRRMAIVQKHGHGRLSFSGYFRKTKCGFGIAKACVHSTSANGTDEDKTHSDMDCVPRSSADFRIDWDGEFSEQP